MSAIEKLEEQVELMGTGYAGLDRQGNIVDRREKKDAVPVKKNKLMGVPEPKNVKSKFERRIDKKIHNCYYGKTRVKFIPFYFEFFGYRLCIYAINLDWNSTRIKIENVKDSYRIVKVLKRGVY